MLDGWRRVRLGDVCTFTRGVTYRSAELVDREVGVPLLNLKCVQRGGGFRSDGLKYFAGRSKPAQSLLPGDLLIAVTDLTQACDVMGSPIVVPADIGSGATFSLDLLKLEIDGSQVDTEYAALALASHEARRFMAGRSTGTTVRHLSPAEAMECRLLIPPLDEQQRIARVLGALNDLIDLDLRLLGHLDQMLMATWTAASRSSQRGLLGDHATLHKGVSYKGEFLSDSGLPLINLGNFGLDGSFREAGSKRYQGPVRAERMLRRRDLVVANTDLTQQRDILARPLLVPFEEATSTHHTFQVTVAAGAAMTAWLYCALRVEPVRRSLIAYSTGTTVAALPADALASLRVPVPDAAVLARWWRAAGALLDAREALQSECQQSKETRDHLLPVLMSGRVVPGEVLL